MVRVKSVGVLSVAKTLAAIYGCISLVIVPFVVIVLLTAGLGAASSEETRGFAAIGVLGAILIAVMLPIFYAAIGFIFGALGAFVYNMVSKRLGGIEFEMEQAPGPGPQ